jgi:hypothetical protein
MEDEHGQAGGMAITRQRWRLIEAIVDAALERAPDERLKFLADACASDSELRREVDSLLAGEHDEPQWWDQPLGDSLAPRIAPGTQVGRYRIVETIGRGGMGEVFRAVDTRLHRNVALKFLPAGWAMDPDALKRFEREARAASALNHPNICTLYDVGEHERQPFLVMELLEGQLLKERLARGPLPFDQALALALQITDALRAAHAKGIVHRDIKPGNLFVVARGQVKVLDFGVSKLLTEPQPERAPGGWKLGSNA